MIARAFVAVLVMLACASRAASGQQPPRDTLRLTELSAAAARLDPRQREVALQRQATALRLRSMAAERLPNLTAEGTAQYQSVVPAFAIQIPNVRFPLLPHDTYDSHILAQERLFDPSLGPREGAERASLGLAEARVQTSVYALRTDVNDAFFSAALAQARAGELLATISDLEAQLRVARARVEEGTALASEAATVEAELLRRRQDLADLDANRVASLAVLAALTGRAISPYDTIIVPDLAASVATARQSLPRSRPEYLQFARSREQLAAEQRVLAAQTLPHVSAFGRIGYAKPGLNFFATDFNSYWLVGLQVQWTPWTWGTNARDRDVLALQQQMVAADEAAFTDATERSVTRQLADIDRLTTALRTDDVIIGLRERIERETQHRYDEAVVTAAEFIDRRNDVLAARLARVGHEIELAQARARYLTTVGVELR